MALLLTTGQQEQGSARFSSVSWADHQVRASNDLLCYLGLLDEAARLYYGIEISLPPLPDKPYEKNQDGYQYRLRINFDNRDYMAHVRDRKARCLELERITSSSTANTSSQVNLSVSILCKLFPFLIVFDSNLKILAVGNKLLEMYPEGALIGHRIPEVARMRRPRVNPSWDNVRQLKTFCYHQLICSNFFSCASYRGSPVNWKCRPTTESQSFYQDTKL